LEGKAGLYNVYYDGEYARDVLVADLGKKFYGAEVSFKPWPACTATHSFIDPALTLAHKYDIHPEDIAAITVFVGDLSQPLCEPLEARRKPATTMDAKFSIPFTTAVAISKRQVVIGDFSIAGLQDAAVLELTQKITPLFDHKYDQTGEHRRGKVEVKMKDGKIYAESTEIPYGHPQNPLTLNDLVKKFRDCLSHAATAVPEENLEQVIDMVNNLEEVADVGTIIRKLV